ncbi:MAG: sel1 repeat family protein [Pseudomonadota bacterium]|nr:sel1 repeat family protein [Pseudomonadota bacterium]QKK06312.1 MAG: sel1 repeat family protein [Pseudomonadota bacterium]
MARISKIFPVFLITAALFLGAPQTAQAFEADLVAIESMGVEAFLPAAETGDVEAQTMTGLAYLTGVGAEQDVPTGLDWLKKAADDNNDAYAQFVLGKILASDTIPGIPSDPAQAKIWLQKAVNQGVQDAGRVLTDMKDADTATETPDALRSKAEKGDAAAQYRLSMAHYFGTDGFEKDLKASLKWLGEAAHGNDAAAQLLLGLRLMDKGYDTDGMIWFKRAVAQKNAEAEYRLGLYYLRYDMSGQNYGAGWRLLQRAAEKGDTRAQKILYSGD